MSRPEVSPLGVHRRRRERNAPEPTIGPPALSIQVIPTHSTPKATSGTFDTSGPARPKRRARTRRTDWDRPVPASRNDVPFPRDKGFRERGRDRHGARRRRCWKRRQARRVLRRRRRRGRHHQVGHGRLKVVPVLVQGDLDLVRAQTRKDRAEEVHRRHPGLRVLLAHRARRSVEFVHLAHRHLGERRRGRVGTC